MPPEPGADAATAGAADQAGTAAPKLTIGGDWPALVTAKVEQVVSLIRDRTVRPVETAVRYVIFALMALSVVGLVSVLLAVFAVRVLDDEVPVFTSRVWASYLVVAGIFWLGGLLCSRMRRPRD